MYCAAIFQNRRAANARWLISGHLAIDWTLNGDPLVSLDELVSKPVQVAALPDSEIVGVKIHNTTDEIYAQVLLNAVHPVVEWLQNIRVACERGEHRLTEAQLVRVVDLLNAAARYTWMGYSSTQLEDLNNYLLKWKDLPDLPEDLYPPTIKLTPDMFELRWHGQSRKEPVARPRRRAPKTGR